MIPQTLLFCRGSKSNFMKISLAVLFFFSAAKLFAQHGPIFPQPSNMENTADSFVFNGQLNLESNEDSKFVYNYFHELFERDHSVHLALSSSADATVHL